MENKYKNSKKKTNPFFGDKNGNKQTRTRVLSLAQLLSRVRKQRGFSGLVQTNSNMQSTSLPSTQVASLQSEGTGAAYAARNSQFGTGSFAGSNQKGVGSYSFVNGNSISSFGENKGDSALSMRERAGRSFTEQNAFRRGDKNFSSSPFPKGTGSVRTGGMTKSQIQNQKEEQKRQKPIKPIIPPKSLVIILREKPEKILYNRRIIDYKHCGLLQRYIGLGGKILPRRQTRLTAKQQRYIAKTIKSARIMGLLPFVSKEKGFFR